MAVALEIVGADMRQVDRHCHAGILRDVGKIPAQRGVICGSLPIRFEMGDIDRIISVVRQISFLRSGRS